MGIYLKGNSKILMMSKCVNGLKYYQSSCTASKMRAKYAYEKWSSELQERLKNGNEPAKQIKILINNSIKPITFAELGQRYLDYAGGRLKSYDRLKSFINTLNKHFGNKKLGDFNMITVENMQSDIIKKGLSVAYTNRLTAVLKRMFVKATDWELITEEDLKRIRKVKLLKGEVKRLRYLADDEAARLISNCDNYLKPILIMALNTGMRKSEIMNLTWDRVDMLNRVILLDTSKNGERREIPINNNLYESLTGIIRQINVKYVFFNPRTLKPYKDIKKGFSAALGKSHILDFRFHDLRHTFASQLVMKSVDLATVRDLMGHKDIKMTLRYSHLSKTHLKDAVNVLNKKNYYHFTTTNGKEGNAGSVNPLILMEPAIGIEPTTR